jgi:hypothetical protein
MRTVSWMISAALLVAAGACEDPLGARRTVVLGITELEVPAQVDPDGPLEGTVTVVLGGCLGFERLRVQRVGPTLRVSAIGSEPTSDRINCPADVRFEPMPLTIAGPFASDLTVEAQSGETLLRRTVRLTE